MNINLKQAEITEALKQFITKQGISLVGKTVAISFTAGRKDAGLSADIVIEDAVAIPGLEVGDEVETTKPVLSVVKSDTPTESPEPTVSTEEVPAAEPETPVKATSLFG